MLTKPPPILNNFAATKWLLDAYREVLFLLPVTRSATPGVSDDMTKGFRVGSVVVDTTADNSFMCMDSTTGAAVWKQIT